MSDETGEQFVVVALFESLESGTSFRRSAWPAHVTLVSNFTTTESVDAIVTAIERVVALDGALTVEFGGSDLFGPRRDIPVRLVVDAPVVAFHRRLATAIESMPSVVADEPGYWHDGYRPHLTLGPSIAAAEGERRVVRNIALARLDKDVAAVVGSTSLPLG